MPGCFSARTFGAARAPECLSLSCHPALPRPHPIHEVCVPSLCSFFRFGFTQLIHLIRTVVRSDRRHCLCRDFDLGDIGACQVPYETGLDLGTGNVDTYVVKADDPYGHFDSDHVLGGYELLDTVCFAFNSDIFRFGSYLRILFSASRCPIP